MSGVLRGEDWVSCQVSCMGRTGCHGRCPAWGGLGVTMAGVLRGEDWVSPWQVSCVGRTGCHVRSGVVCGEDWVSCQVSCARRTGCHHGRCSARGGLGVTMAGVVPTRHHSLLSPDTTIVGRIGGTSLPSHPPVLKKTDIEIMHSIVGQDYSAAYGGLRRFGSASLNRHLRRVICRWMP